MTIFNAIKFYKTSGWNELYNNGAGIVLGTYISITAIMLLTKRKKLSPEKWMVKRDSGTSTD